MENDVASQFGSPLNVLLGEWDIDIRHPQLDAVRAHTTFEPLGAFVVQRTTVEHPDFPDGVSVLGETVMHYFDERGVARIYEMSLDERTWTLERGPKDASDFGQRFHGDISEEGRTIEGRWEKSDDGSEWELDFPMTLSKVG